MLSGSDNSMWWKYSHNENFLKLLQKHAGGDEKLQIKFHWPNNTQL